MRLPFTVDTRGKIPVVFYRGPEAEDSGFLYRGHEADGSRPIYHEREQLIHSIRWSCGEVHRARGAVARAVFRSTPWFGQQASWVHAS